ncbi:GNAT family N-acetyltransferase [Wenyingzhuangia sp. IMCC45533]
MDQTLKIYFAKRNDFSDQTINSICNLINKTYEKGEEGLWAVNSNRTSVNELKKNIRNNQLIVAEEKGLIIGTVLVKKMKDGITGEFGMLSVDINYKRKGIGNKLIKKAEEWAVSNELNIMKLELLTPSNWKHHTKEFLKKWYSKLGYVPQEKESCKKKYPELFLLLKTDCDLTIWSKKLKAN